MSCIPSSLVAAKMLTNAILNKEKEFSLIKICVDVKSMMNWDFNYKEFVDTLYDFPNIKIEFLWNLHVLQIVPFDVSLTRFRSEETIQNICNLCLMDSSEDKALEFVQLGLISYLMNRAFSSNGEEIEKVCLSIMQSFLRELFSLRSEDKTKRGVKNFFSLWKCGLIESKTLLEFCIYSLHQFLNDQNIEMMEAFLIQEHCYSHFEPFHVTSVIEKIIKTLTPDHVVCILFETNFEKAINWKHYIVILEAFMRTFDSESKVILRNTEELVKRSLKYFDQNALKKAIIIGRQAALHSKEPFLMAYNQWFLKQFGDSLYVKSPENMSFLVQVLSEFVPYEKNVGILKVYLERPLTVTPECQSIYNDYVVLLKTRIKDLEPQVQPEDVISKLLSVYQETGKIPSYVMEASLMRKQYFLNAFLPVLLTPRVVASYPDARERFIEELHRIGKIPGVIFQKYKTACDQENQKCLEGIDVDSIFMDEDT